MTVESCDRPIARYRIRGPIIGLIIPLPCEQPESRSGNVQSSYSVAVSHKIATEEYNQINCEQELIRSKYDMYQHQGIVCEER